MGDLDVAGFFTGLLIDVVRSTRRREAIHEPQLADGCPPCRADDKFVGSQFLRRGRRDQFSAALTPSLMAAPGRRAVTDSGVRGFTSKARFPSLGRAALACPPQWPSPSQ